MVLVCSLVVWIGLPHSPARKITVDAPLRAHATHAGALRTLSPPVLPFWPPSGQRPVYLSLTPTLPRKPGPNRRHLPPEERHAQ